jgi:hypothetical protein
MDAVEGCGRRIDASAARKCKDANGEIDERSQGHGPDHEPGHVRVLSRRLLRAPEAVACALLLRPVGLRSGTSQRWPAGRVRHTAVAASAPAFDIFCGVQLKRVARAALRRTPSTTVIRRPVRTSKCSSCVGAGALDAANHRRVARSGLTQLVRTGVSWVRSWRVEDAGAGPE